VCPSGLFWRQPLLAAYGHQLIAALHNYITGEGFSVHTRLPPRSFFRIGGAGERTVFDWRFRFHVDKAGDSFHKLRGDDVNVLTAAARADVDRRYCIDPAAGNSRANKTLPGRARVVVAVSGFLEGTRRAYLTERGLEIFNFPCQALLSKPILRTLHGRLHSLASTLASTLAARKASNRAERGRTD
jgi:hypothetical protein